MSLELVTAIIKPHKLDDVKEALLAIGVDLVEHFRVDDPIGAVAVHGCCGIWGTWAVGLFATGQYGATATTAAVKGLFWGGGLAQLWAQIWGNLAIGGVAFVVMGAVFLAINAFGLLRVSAEGEQEGIDIHEHGSPAYHPEPAYMGQGLS